MALFDEEPEIAPPYTPPVDPDVDPVTPPDESPDYSDEGTPPPYTEPTPDPEPPTPPVDKIPLPSGYENTLPLSSYVTTLQGTFNTLNDFNFYINNVSTSTGITTFDGKYQILAPSNDFLQVSNNYGNTWTPKISTLDFRGAAISRDGKYQTVVANNNFIYRSQNYGSTFSALTSVQDYWEDVSMSYDGKYQTAVGGDIGFESYIYVSSNYGSTFIEKGAEKRWSGISMSYDGKYQTAVESASAGFIYTSSDFGNTWTPKTSGFTGFWTGVSLSYTGKYQTTVNSSPSGYIWVSQDFGNTWTNKLEGDWQDVSISYDGSYQTAIDVDGGIYVSSDYGNTWTTTFSGISGAFNGGGVSVSHDGKYQLVGDSGYGYAYISFDYGASWISEFFGFNINATAINRYEDLPKESQIEITNNSSVPLFINSVSSVPVGGKAIIEDISFVDDVGSLSGYSGGTAVSLSISAEPVNLLDTTILNLLNLYYTYSIGETISSAFTSPTTFSTSNPRFVPCGINAYATLGHGDALNYFSGNFASINAPGNTTRIRVSLSAGVEYDVDLSYNLRDIPEFSDYPYGPSPFKVVVYDCNQNLIHDTGYVFQKINEPWIYSFTPYQSLVHYNKELENIGTEKVTGYAPGATTLENLSVQQNNNYIDVVINSPFKGVSWSLLMNIEQVNPPIVIPAILEPLIPLTFMLSSWNTFTGYISVLNNNTRPVSGVFLELLYDVPYIITPNFFNIPAGGTQIIQLSTLSAVTSGSIYAIDSTLDINQTFNFVQYP